MIRVATFLWTGGRLSCAALVTPTQVLKADQTNRCVDSLTLNKLISLHDVGLLKLSFFCQCLSLSFSFSLSICFKTGWFTSTPSELSPLFLSASLSLAYLALEPPSYSHPGSQSLSKGILLFLPACSSLELHLAQVWERGFCQKCGH